MGWSTALGIEVTSFFEERKKDKTESPTPIFYRGNAQMN
jgi:hypothetical protein